MVKKVTYDKEAHKRLLYGSEMFAKAIGLTLGPVGKNILIKESETKAPYLTRNLTAIADAFKIADPVAQMAVDILKEGLAGRESKSVGLSGYSVVLANALFQSGARELALGRDLISLKRGLEKAASHVCLEVDTQKREVSDGGKLFRMATAFANGDVSAGKILARVFETVGPDGLVSLEKSAQGSTEYEIVEGMEVDGGFSSPYFINDPEQMRAVYEHPTIFITDKTLTTTREVMPILERHFFQSSEPLIILAEGMKEGALATLIVNNVKGDRPVVAAQIPRDEIDAFDRLEDIAAFTGARVFSFSKGDDLEKLDGSYFGSAKRVEISGSHTKIIEGHGKKTRIEERLNHLAEKKHYAKTTAETDQIASRVANLTGDCVVVKTPDDATYEKYQKAIALTKLALKDGITVGSGNAFIHMSQKIPQDLKEEELLGFQIMFEALKTPLCHVAEGLGLVGDVVVDSVKSNQWPYGLDPHDCTYGDLLKLGIVDPARIVKNSVLTATSLATMLMTVSVVITKSS